MNNLSNWFIFSAIMFFALGQIMGNNPDLLATINVSTGESERNNTIVSIDLDEITDADDSEIVLYEIRGNDRYPVSTQISHKGKRKMVWQLGKNLKPNTKIVYELSRGMAPLKPKIMHVREESGTYTFMKGNRAVMRYNAATVYPPEGIDQVFKRSGFIHPLYAPNRSVLTTIQPADHIHHYGLWNPWTNTTFRGETVDFWNLAKKQGTVQNAGIKSLIEGPVFAEVTVLHEHIAWPESTRQVLAMNENHTMRVFHYDDNMFWIEFEFQITPQEPITLEEFRYGGFVFRGTEGWTNQTSGFITSEGLDRDHADGERARWCIVTGETPSGEAGILFMGHPENYNHPEPLRVWPSDANRGRGDVFVNFSPTRNTSWDLEKNMTYVLKYRLMVFDGDMDIKKAENYWNDYVNPVQVHWETRNH
jgi:hypothetical protein